MAVDTEKMERVVFNVLSNAFKYTPDNGEISLKACISDNHLIIKINDSGKGISEADIKHVFDRFFQVDRIHTNGSGIGLSLAKAFVELHEGTIGVESEPGQGSEFTINIPVVHVESPSESMDPPAMSDVDVEAELAPVEAAKIDIDDNKPLMLVIDDNDDIRKLISGIMSDEYNVITARDGGEGVKLAAKYVPDIIICDVMMPRVDGLECCRRLKSEITTSHIPVLMVTACSLDEQRVEGYDSGADGYISKPFSTEVLRARCRNLIQNRHRIREVLGDSKSNEPARAELQATAAASEIDDEFYHRFLQIVEEEMGSNDLNVDSLAARLGLGRSQFYRKIKSLTNYSPVELLRNMRLKRGRELLTTTSKSISEVTYEVGFSTPAYFTKCYRETYGETPTELRARLS